MKAETTRLRPWQPSEDPRALYAQARYAAVTGDSGAVLELLKAASRGGYPMDRIERDPDLAALRGKFDAVFPD